MPDKEYDPLNLDDLDLDNLDLDDEDEDPIEYAETIDTVAEEKGLPVPNADKRMSYMGVDIVKRPDNLMKYKGNRKPRIIRFPFATMKVGDSFKVDADPDSEMRKALKYDRTKFLKLPGMSNRRYHVCRTEDSDEVYCVRENDRKSKLD